MVTAVVPGIELPDLSRPPPGFHTQVPPPLMQPEIMPDDLLPSLPYYDLPAGLMVPLIKVKLQNKLQDVCF